MMSSNEFSILLIDDDADVLEGAGGLPGAPEPAGPGMGGLPAVREVHKGAVRKACRRGPMTSFSSSLFLLQKCSEKWIR